MEYLAVLAAAFAAFAFGAVWYMTLSKHWIIAAGIKLRPDGKPDGNGSAMPFAIGAIALLMVSYIMHHIMVMSGLDSLLDGLMAGFGIGAFIVFPWTAMNYGYAARPRMLTVIDGGYGVIGCTIIGVVLSLFL